MGFPMFPIGPMTGPTEVQLRGLEPPSTSHVRIASFDEGGFRMGGAGANVRYPISSAQASVEKETFGTVNSKADLFNTLRNMKHNNGDQPLSRITLATHGGPGSIQFGDDTIVSAPQLARDLVNQGLLARGGELRFDACEVAGDEAARTELSSAAQDSGVKIIAAESLTVDGLPASWWAFEKGEQNHWLGW